MSSYPFDQFQRQFYRIFEGMVLEGVVANHAGPPILAHPTGTRRCACASSLFTGSEFCLNQNVLH